MVKYNDGLFSGLNQLDQVSHNLAFGVNTCCSLNMVLVLNVALYNSHPIQMHTKYFLFRTKSQKKILLLLN